MIALDLPALAAKASYPGTAAIPPVSRVLSLLAPSSPPPGGSSTSMTCSLGQRPVRLPVGAPKKSALTDYSYRPGHNHQQRCLAALDQKVSTERAWRPVRWRSST